MCLTAQHSSTAPTLVFVLTASEYNNPLLSAIQGKQADHLHFCLIGLIIYIIVWISQSDVRSRCQLANVFLNQLLLTIVSKNTFLLTSEQCVVLQVQLSLMFVIKSTL